MVSGKRSNGAVEDGRRSRWEMDPSNGKGYHPGVEMEVDISPDPDGGPARRLQPVDRSGSVEREKWRWKWNGGEVQL